MKITLSLWWMYIQLIMCSLFEVILFEFIFKIYFSLFPLKFPHGVRYHWNDYYSEIHSKFFFRISQRVFMSYKLLAVSCILLYVSTDFCKKLHLVWPVQGTRSLKESVRISGSQIRPQNSQYYLNRGLKSYNFPKVSITFLILPTVHCTLLKSTALTCPPKK